jgi:phosphatidylinositol-3-phosphatase
MGLRTSRAKAAAVAAVTGVAAVLTAGLSAASGAVTGSSGGGGQRVQLDRAFIIVLENHSQKSVIGDPNTPFITSLARQYGQATSYFGVTHPSEPNYVAMISGSNWWTNNDDPANRFDYTNLVDELEASHISWGAYMEAMPADDPLTDFWPSSANPLYASKHNPFALFTDIRDNPARVANIKPYTALAGDLNSGHAPRFVYITPDQCNDMHGGVNTAVPGHPETPCPYNTTNDDPNDVLLKQNADKFVHRAVTTIMSSRAWTPHSAIFIVADEGDYTGNAVNGGWDSRPAAATRRSCPRATPTSAPSGLVGSTAVRWCPRS